MLGGCRNWALNKTPFRALFVMRGFRPTGSAFFRGQCAELCGKNHAFMPIVVRAVSEEDYIAWIEEQGGVVSAADDKPLRIGQTTASAKKEEKSVEWNMKEAMKRGETAYKTYCAACHQATAKDWALSGAEKFGNRHRRYHRSYENSHQRQNRPPPWPPLIFERRRPCRRHYYERNAWETTPAIC